MRSPLCRAIAGMSSSAPGSVVTSWRTLPVSSWLRASAAGNRSSQWCRDGDEFPLGDADFASERASGGRRIGSCDGRLDAEALEFTVKAKLDNFIASQPIALPEIQDVELARACILAKPIQSRTILDRSRYPRIGVEFNHLVAVLFDRTPAILKLILQTVTFGLFVTAYPRVDRGSELSVG